MTPLMMEEHLLLQLNFVSKTNSTHTDDSTLFTSTFLINASCFSAGNATTHLWMGDVVAQYTVYYTYLKS